MRSAATLQHVGTTTLKALQTAIDQGVVKTPLHRAALVGIGLHHIDDVLAVLTGHSRPACLAILDVVLAERSRETKAPEIVWTGPEAQVGTVRDTVVVLREMFERAEKSVSRAGYRFDHAKDVLAPLHRVMVERGVDVRFVVDVEQIKSGVAPEEHLRKQLGGFFAQSWPFVGPRPRIYYDKRALVPGPPWCSMHAKCVAVDGKRAFVSSANFTERGQERNIEVGVLLRDASVAEQLAGHWLGLMEGGVLGELSLA